MRAEGLEPLGEPGRTMDLAGNPKGRGYPNQARPGGIDRMEGREEIVCWEDAIMGLSPAGEGEYSHG